ncbi:porin [Glaciimonas sp. PCH181]|uniref:porin n=1 Tax=Glaciimonas sp. PCH181 TaxID=2133943 RepID=UPI000D3839E0|nr:porin [Glaciimonas sp. PCH181]PUA20049.1 hypothetical protein C7W93_09680 [Glaciimonas sp. PCH181]
MFIKSADRSNVNSVRFSSALRKTLRISSVGLLVGMALIAGKAEAQSNVQIYGVVDNAIQTTWGKGPSGQTRTEMTSGYFAASRLGFKGTEDLGDGMKAFYQLEMGFGSDTGALQQGGRLFGRTSQVGINTSLGSLAFGRLGTPGSGTGPYNMTNGPKAIDPFYLGYGAAGWANTSNVMALPLRGDNSIMYRSPNMKGLTFAGLYSFQRDGAELPGGNSANASVIGLGLSYDHGPLFAMVSYDHINNPITGKPAQTALQIGAVYDFKVMKLHFLAGKERGEFLFSTAVEQAVSDATFADVGMTIPTTSGRIMLSLQSRNASQSQGAAYGRRIASVGYTYDLSKRTALNMAFSDSMANKSMSGNKDFNFLQAGFGISHFF